MPGSSIVPLGPTIFLMPVSASSTDRVTLAPEPCAWRSFCARPGGAVQGICSQIICGAGRGGPAQPVVDRAAKPALRDWHDCDTGKFGPVLRTQQCEEIG